MIHLSLLKFYFLTITLIYPFKCLSCNKLKLRSIIRGNYQDVLRLENGPLIISKKTNSFAGGFNNGIFVRDSIYLISGSVGFTSCALSNSIIIELRQAYELNTLVFWLYDRSVRTYGLIVYASYENVETIILDTLATVGVIRVTFTEQLVKQFRFYNRNGNTANTALHIIKAEAFYEL